MEPATNRKDIDRSESDALTCCWKLLRKWLGQAPSPRPSNRMPDASSSRRPLRRWLVPALVANRLVKRVMGVYDPFNLQTPDDAYLLKGGTRVVADVGNCRILFISSNKRIVRQYGTTGVCSHDPPYSFASPNGGTRSPTGARHQDRRIVDRSPRPEGTPRLGGSRACLVPLRRPVARPREGPPRGLVLPGRRDDHEPLRIRVAVRPELGARG